MNDHCPIYNDLMAQADRVHDEWNMMLDRALLLFDHGRIDQDEYYRKMGEVKGLQEKYVELRDQAINADRLFWLEEETATEYRQRVHDETPF